MWAPATAPQTTSFLCNENCTHLESRCVPLQCPRALIVPVNSTTVLLSGGSSSTPIAPSMRVALLFNESLEINCACQHSVRIRCKDDGALERLGDAAASDTAANETCVATTCVSDTVDKSNAVLILQRSGMPVLVGLFLWVCLTLWHTSAFGVGFCCT